MLCEHNGVKNRMFMRRVISIKNYKMKDKMEEVLNGGVFVNDMKRRTNGGIYAMH